MVKKGSLSYSRPNNKVVSLGDELALRMMVINSEIVRLYFVDEEGKSVPVPEGFSVTKTDVALAPPEPQIDEQFIVTCYHSYSVRYRDTSFRLERQVQQAVEGPADLIVMAM